MAASNPEDTLVLEPSQVKQLWHRSPGSTSTLAVKANGEAGTLTTVAMYPQAETGAGPGQT